MRATFISIAGAITVGFMLAGCGASSGPPVAGALNADTQTRADSTTKYRVLSVFGHFASGSRPDGGLINVDGTLYGVTAGGGLDRCTGHYGGGPTYCGTVYSMTTDGVRHVLYKFKGGSDGGRPRGRLLDVDGTLYGTTSLEGSQCRCGTVFSVSRSGSEKVLHEFAGGSDGATPLGGLIDVNGVLYGTTEFGGLTGVCGNSTCGTVYSISTAGKERVLHRFGRKHRGDGVWPVAGLINVGGTLYGTTLSGGWPGTEGGTVYSITPDGLEKVLYRFKGDPDASSPYSHLTDVNGTMYGTTAGGGTYGSGAVFGVSTKGVEKVVYSFPGYGSVHFGPGNPVTYFSGQLYVATQEASSGCRVGYGCLYSITMNGKATVLHEFNGGSDGCFPSSGLLAVNGTLYGTTVLGGIGKQGCHGSAVPGGTVYTWTP